MNDESKETRGKAAFKKWYDANKKAFNATRKKKYEADEGMRIRARERQKDYRKRVGPLEKPHERLVNGVPTTVFRITEAAKFVGREAQALKNWETAGLIPSPLVNGAKHRYYTVNQVKLMRELADLITILRHGDKEAMEIGLANKSDEIHQCWEN